MKNLETFDSIYFRDESYFEDDGTQIYLVFKTVSKYSKTFSANNSNILSWKSKEMCDESIKPLTMSNKVLNPSLDYVGTEIRVKVNGDCLKQEKVPFNHGKIVNTYIIYEIEKCVNISSYPTLESYLV